MADIKNNEILTPDERAVIGSIVRGNGNLPDKMEGEEYEEFYGEVLGAEMQAMKRQPLSDRQREILQEEIKHYKNGVEELAKSLHCHPDHIKAALGDKEAIKGLITSTIDNMQFISEVIDRYEKYAPALESFDKIATKEDIAAWLKQVDKMVGKDIDDPLRQAGTSLMRLNEAQYPTFLACMEEYRKDPMLLSSVYFDKVAGGDEQHAKMDDVILRANELGLDFHPFVISGGIGVDNFDDGVDITSKEFKYASVEKDDIIVYEKEQDLFGFNSGYSISDLPEEAQNAVLDQIFDDLFAVNDPLLIVYDRKEVPAYALSAIVNGDFSGIDDPEDEQNIRDFMEKNKGYIFSVDSESRGFSDNPAFGLPTDCETVFMVKTVSPKELLEQQKAGKQETVEEAPVTLEGDRLEVGMKVIWNDPESQYRDPDRIYTIDKINGEVISISDEHGEVEVGASELSVATQKQDVDQDKFLNYVIHGDRRYPIYQNLEARLNAFMKAFKVDIPLSNILYGTNSKSGRWSDLHQTASRAIESILRASGNGDEKLMNSTTADYVSDKAKNLAKGMMRAIYSDEESYEIRREEALKAIGYPYKHGLGVDGSFNIPTVDKSLYWDYAAGLISINDAAREFNRCGWTHFVDEKYTLKKFEEINKEFGKLDANLKPLVNQPKVEIKTLATKLFGDNVALSLWSYPEVDRVCLGEMPDTITIDGIEIKDGNLKLMSDDLGGEIAQENFTGEELERISEMLKELHSAYEQAHKAGESEDKRPLIKVVYDEGLSNSRGRDLYLGDNGRYFTRQPEGALSYDDDGKVIKDNWKWVICTDNYYLEPDYAYDKYARFEIVDSHKFAEEQDRLQELSDAKEGAKQAIHDRITNSWQRSFTSDQVEILNRYHQVAAPDKPAGEVFRELLDEVSQEPDVARKPVKWVTDTAKELDGLAEGITREQGQGLKR